MAGNIIRKDVAVQLTVEDGDDSVLITDADGKLWVTGSVGGGGGTEYAEGATAATATGTAILWKDTGNALVAVSATSPLPVEVTGTQNVTVAGTPNVAVTSHTTQNASLLPSSARTTEQTVAFTNEFWKGVLLIVDVTTGAATPVVTPTIQYQDPVTSTWLNYWTATAAITSVGAAQYKYMIYPGISATEPSTVTEIFEFPLPRTCRLRMTVGDTDSLTYSVAAIFLV